MASIISKEEIFKVYERVKAGESVYQIAAEYNVSETYFYRRFGVMGLKLPPRKRGPNRARPEQDLTEQEVRDAHAKYSNGAVLAVVAHELNIASSVLRRRFIQYGLPRSVPRGYTAQIPDEVKEKIMAEYMSGVAICLLVKKYKMSFYTVKAICDASPYSVNRKIPPELAKKIYEELQGDLTWEQVSKKYSITHKRLKKVFEALGWKPVREAHNLNHVPTEEILEHYGAGLTLEKIGEKYGIHKKSLGAILKRRGVKLPHRKHTYQRGRRVVISDQTLDEVTAMLEKKLSLTKIAKQLNLHYNTLKAIYEERRGEIKKNRPGAKALLSDHQIITAHQQLTDGLDRDIVCKELDVLWDTLKKSFVRLGLDPINKPRPKPFQRQDFSEAEIIMAYEKRKAGASRKDVCALLKVSWTEVVKQFTKFNLPPLNEVPTSEQIKKSKTKQKQKRKTAKPTPPKQTPQATPAVLAHERRSGASVESLAKKYKLEISEVRRMLLLGFTLVKA